jgi:hypothetical protein
MIPLNYKLDNDENLLFKTTSKKGIHPYIKKYVLLTTLIFVTFGSIAFYLITKNSGEIIIYESNSEPNYEEDKLISIYELENIIDLEQKKSKYPNYLNFIQNANLNEILNNTPFSIWFIGLFLILSIFFSITLLLKNSKPNNTYIFTNKRILEINPQTQTSYYWNIFIPEIKTYKSTISLSLKMFHRTSSERHISRYYPVPFHLFFNEQDNIEVMNIIKNHIIQDKKI